MTKLIIAPNASCDVASPGEVREIMEAGLAQLADREHYRAIKVMDLPALTGKVANSAITLGPAAGQLCGPQSGYAWSVMCLVVTGLTSGASPDVLNFYKNDTSRPIWWQLNGNQFGETFGKLHRVLYSGESLAAANSGTLAATGVITVTGTIIELPAEQLAKLA